MKAFAVLQDYCHTKMMYVGHVLREFIGDSAFSLLEGKTIL